MADSLVIEVISGADAPERCHQAFTVAAAACAAGVPVEVWLSGEAAWLAVPVRAAGREAARRDVPRLGAEGSVAGLEPELGELLELVLELGRVRLCTQAAARRSIGPEDLREGITIAGAASYVERILREGTQTLSY